MTKRTIYLLGILITIVLGTWLYIMMCPCCSQKGLVDEELSLTNRSITPFAFNNSEINYSVNDNFKFPIGSYDFVQPVSDSINNGISMLKDYLQTGGKSFSITGYALNSEEDQSIYTNLGYARANAVKNYFVKMGIPSNLISLNGNLVDSLSIMSDTIYGPITYHLSDPMAAESSSPETNWDEVKDSINASPLLIYFETGQYRINLSAEDRLKVVAISEYLSHVPDAKIEVVGHTDNVGNADSNYELGLGRAEAAKDHLIKNGVDGTRILTSSKGQDFPISDNSTEEGRSLNRRSEIIIQ